MATKEDIKNKLKERGHKVIREETIEDFDKFVDSIDYDVRFLEYVLSICETMRDKELTIEQRRRKAYDQFNEYDHSGSTAYGCLNLIRRFCYDGDVLAAEIEDFKYDPNGSLSERRAYEERMRPIREREHKIAEAEKQRRTFAYHQHGNYKLPIYTTNGPMFKVDFPYKFDLDVAVNILNILGKKYGMVCCTDYYKPIFSFDTMDTVYLRMHGMTREEWDIYKSLWRDGKFDEAEEYRNNCRRY